MDLEGRTAVVTGGAQETGRAIALRLAAAGAHVVIADRDEEHGEEAARASGGRATFVRTDVTDDAELRRALRCEPQVLVNNAGGWGAANYPQALPEQWSKTLDLNLRAAMLATQLVLEPMHAAGGGAVVNIASTAGIASGGYASPEYGAAKAGLIRFTTSLADLKHVRVNCVVPDWIATERGQRELAAMSPEEQRAQPPQVPMDDVASAVLAFVRDDSMRGRVVVLRGGEPRRFLP